MVYLQNPILKVLVETTVTVADPSEESRGFGVTLERCNTFVSNRRTVRSATDGTAAVCTIHKVVASTRATTSVDKSESLGMFNL